MSILAPILVLAFLIFFHELGHFLVAKFFGIRVEVFSIGFGKKIAKKTIGNTEYALSAIPLGGYVKLKGQDDLDPKKTDFAPDSYMSKRPWQRICVLFAGSGFNLLLAFLLYITIAFVGANALLPVVGSVAENMPAQGVLEQGDVVVAINEEGVKTWEAMSAKIAQSSGQIRIDFMRNNESKTAFITPKIAESKNIFGEIIEKNMVGIGSAGAVGVVAYSGFEALSHAWGKFVDASTLILQSIQKLISGVVSPKEIGGVVSIVSVISEASQSGVVTLLALTALISINLGILNLLPIPALDGGHIIFSLYEWVRGRRPSIEMLYRLTIFGWILLGALLLLGLYNDIVRLSG